MLEREGGERGGGMVGDGLVLKMGGGLCVVVLVLLLMTPFLG